MSASRLPGPRDDVSGFGPDVVPAKQSFFVPLSATLMLVVPGREPQPLTELRAGDTLYLEVNQQPRTPRGLGPPPETVR